ncbi:MAG: hypothetical protein KIT60_10720 [Burkholderiaceae bacterium]|nr:hypothetical protein [Burkholderiaceae bacterium]
MRWLATAVATAALAACGGGGGDDSSNNQPGPVNQAPSATLDAPAANATFANGETIRITATAADSDGSVSKVEFFADGVKIGEDTSAPFEFDWVNPPTGTHMITVRATDNAGAVTLSAERQVTTLAANQMPTVSVSAPTNNFKANEDTTVLLSANADDADGSVAKVEFFNIDPAAPVYDSTTLVGEATAVGTPPAYQLTTVPLAPGVYNFAARATDNQGGTATSGSVQVMINALPVITLTSPTAGANVIPGTNLTLRATATDADSGIAKVEFFLDGSTTPLGVGTKNGDEYTLTWTTTLQGAYAFTARATDNDGATQTTGSVAVNVPANVLPTVTLDNPAAGTNVPTTLNLSASAADGDGSVTGVEFAYTIGGVTTKGNGTLAAGKWTLAVPIGAAQFGTYAVTATVTDNLGGTTTSPSKNITIAANVPPVVNVTSSAAVTLDVGNAAKSFTLAASASDSDGVAKVEFFSDGVKIGEDTTAPYQLSHSFASGTYAITAKATDTVGSVTTSAEQSLVVTPNLEGNWATLNTAQKAGLASLTPDRPIPTDGATVAGAVMTAIGVNTVQPKFVVAMAQGLRRLADLPVASGNTVSLPTTAGYVACPGGSGTVKVESTGTANENFVNLNNCKIGDFTFYGGADLPNFIQTFDPLGPETCPVGNQVPGQPTQCSWPSVATYHQLSANSFRIVVSSVMVSGYGSPEVSTGPYPHNAYGYGVVECTVTNGVKSCLTNHENSFLWGSDLAWTDWADNGTTAITTPWNYYSNDDPYKVNGVVRPCQADPVPPFDPDYCKGQEPAGTAYTSHNRVNFHIKFDSMTNVAGRAIVYGSNGWSVVTRLAPIPGNPTATPTPTLPIERVTVQSTATGVSPTTKTYNCPVDSNGFFVCVEAP